MRHLMAGLNAMTQRILPSRPYDPRIVIRQCRRKIGALMVQELASGLRSTESADGL